MPAPRTCAEQAPEGCSLISEGRNHITVLCWHTSLHQLLDCLIALLVLISQRVPGTQVC